MSEDTINMALVGDMYLRSNDPDRLFALTGSHVQRADIVLGNLEAPISDRGTPADGKIALPMGVSPTQSGKTAYRSEPYNVASLTVGGFSAVGLANNHSMDHGAEAILQTMKILDDAGIGHAGAGHNIAEAHEPAIVESKGTRVALLSYASVFPPTYAAEEDKTGIAVVRVVTAYQPSPRIFEQPASPAISLTFPNAADLQAMRDDIEKARKRAHIVVLSWHWGISQAFRKLVPYQVELGHAAIDAGADLVIGHHPHVLQAIEVYRGKVICYSLANFAFCIKSRFYDREAIVLKCQIRGKRIERVAFLPILAEEDFRPRVLDLIQGEKIVEQMRELSADFGTTLISEGSEMVIAYKPN